MRKTPTLLLSFALLLLSCSSITMISDNRKPTVAVQAGIGHGGIIENTDLKQIPNVQPDAFTGATKISPVLGVHAKLPVFKNDIESGLDFMYSNQTFKYNDLTNSFRGDRDLSTSQIMLPVTYNFNLFRKTPGGLLALKVGAVFQYNMVSIDDKSVDLPSYEINHFSRGMIFGISSSPVNFQNGAKMGFTIDFYRGSRIYTDFYNQKNFKMPGSSFMKFGITYQFR